MNNNNFMSYIRHEGKKVGVMVAGLIDGKVRVGYSVCNIETDDKDKFNRDFGLSIAKGRMNKDRVLVPEHLKDLMMHFSDRVKKFFKDKEIDFTIMTYKEHFISRRKKSA